MNVLDRLNLTKGNKMRGEFRLRKCNGAHLYFDRSFERHEHRYGEMGTDPGGETVGSTWQTFILIKLVLLKDDHTFFYL